MRATAPRFSRCLCCITAGLSASLWACATGPDASRVHRVIDGWHAAAARGDAGEYFGAMADDAVFLGTDATERWPLEAFREFASPYFGRTDDDGAARPAWVYVPRG